VNQSKEEPLCTRPIRSNGRRVLHVFYHCLELTAVNHVTGDRLSYHHT